VALGSIPSPSFDGFHIGPFDIRVYGLCYVLAVLAAVAVTTRRWEAQGGSRAIVQECALWGFPAGIVGARLYFLATSWNEVPDHWWGPLAVWKGGLGIWGGIAGGVAVGIWRLRRAGVDVPRFLDAAAPGLLVAQAIGRVGNWFNQELFGKPTSLPWGLRIDPEHRPDRYLDRATFHPTFLYEIGGTSRSRPPWSGSASAGTSDRPASSRSTSPATRRSGSSRSCCASIPPTTSSGCGSTSSSRWGSRSWVWRGSRGWRFLVVLGLQQRRRVRNEEHSEADEGQHAGDAERQGDRLLEREHQRQADHEQRDPGSLHRAAAHGSNLCPRGS
jgi:hypothetical protein